MKRLSARYIYDGEDFKHDFGFVFDRQILDVGPNKELARKYPDIDHIDYGDKLVMPGLINAHQHLEFSANKATLSYGKFMPWLHSVIENRDTLMGACDEKMIDKALSLQLAQGTTAIGQISSGGSELKAVAKAKQRVVFFNELIGSDPAMVDALYGDFQSRVAASCKYESAFFKPAVAIHSPYSVHPVVLQKALDFAKQNDLTVSTHFLESSEEKQWLEENSGGFLPFFQKFLNQTKAVNSADEFLQSFPEKTLFTHCNYANTEQRRQLRGHYVTHCPVSNRLLGSKRLDIAGFDNLILATDGLSSNFSLSLFDEMRAALMVHDDLEINDLARRLLRAVTKTPARALGLNCGAIEKDRDADFIAINLPEAKIKQLALHTILHTKIVAKTYIAGELLKD
ncbi:MAG: aminofutalosine deaminase family hydrolase [Campylobacterota bacterium]